MFTQNNSKITALQASLAISVLENIQADNTTSTEQLQV
jgi:uncharacterized protein (UPF0147 family)